MATPSFRQKLLRRLWKRSLLRANAFRASPLTKLLKSLNVMAQPHERSQPSTHFRRFRNLVGSYIDTKVAYARDVTSRGLEEQLTRQESVVAESVTLEEEKLVLYPTYARVKPHLLHMTHHHTSTSEHGSNIGEGC